MLKSLNPAGVPQPASSYSQGVEVSGAGRTLFISGQVAVRPDGSPVGGDFAAQAAQVWANVVAMLKGAGMGVENLVHVNTYLVSTNDIQPARAERSKVLGNHRPASTMVIVSALASPDWKIEVEAVAFKAAPAARATVAARRPATKRAKKASKRPSRRRR
jgi:enamine deaminase RidA (YjgF/YER057c/UK114 family)